MNKLIDSLEIEYQVLNGALLDITFKWSEELLLGPITTTMILPMVDLNNRQKQEIADLGMDTLFDDEDFRELLDKALKLDKEPEKSPTNLTHYVRNSASSITHKYQPSKKHSLTK